MTPGIEWQGPDSNGVWKLLVSLPQTQGSTYTYQPIVAKVYPNNWGTGYSVLIFTAHQMEPPTTETLEEAMAIAVALYQLRSD